MADAQITVGADVSAVERAAATAKNSWRNAASEMTSAITNAARSTVGALAEVAVAQGKVNFSAQADQVRAFEASTARMSVAAGRDLETLRGSIEATGASIGRRPSEVVGWATEVGKLTYNFKGAIDAQKGLAGIAAETGRSVDDFKGLAVELATVGKVSGDTTGAIGVLAAQSEKLGNAGGIAAFADQVTGLSDTISKFAVSSTKDFTTVTALAGALGRGLNPQAAGRVQQNVLGALQSDPMRWERYLGRTLMDEHGQIPAKDLPKIVGDIVAKAEKTFGAKNARRILQQNFGNEEGAAMWNATHGGGGLGADLAGLTPSTKPAAAAAALRNTDAGKREAAAGQLETSSRALLGSSTMLGKAADALQQFAAKNPFTSTMMTGIGTALAGTLTSSITTGIGTALKAVMGAGGGAGGMARAAVGLSAGGPLAALGIGGAVLGAGLYGIHKWEQAGNERIDAIENAGVSENKHRLMLQNKSRSTRVAQLEALGMSHGMAVFSAEHEKDKSNPLARAQAIDAEFQAKLAKAIQDGMSKAQIKVQNASGGPVEVTARGGGQSAGNQSEP
jgi:hypothetical protein